MNVQLFFDCAAVVSDLSENVTRQGEFLLAGIASGRKCTVDVRAVGRAAGKRAFCEPIMVLMLVVIGMVVPQSSPLLRMVVLRPTRTH